MSAQLVLVTTNYPYAYNGGELTFVAPEIERLVREFGSVRVVPLHAEGERGDVPAGVEIDASLSRALQRERWSSLWRAPRWPGFGAEMRRALRHGGWVGCARVWRWAAMAETTYRWAVALFPEGGAVLFYTYWRGGSTVALARMAQRRPATAVVTRVHGHELYEDRYRPPFQPWHPALYRELAFTAAVSQHGYDYLGKAGVEPARLVLARLGTEAPARLARGSQDGALRIVSCSFLWPVKRVPSIAEAVVAFAAAHPERSIHWTHYGDGTKRGRVGRVLRRAPANLRCQLPGRVANGVVLAHYASEPVDAFVLLSESEGLPVSIQEAASAGIPIVATDVGGVRELVGNDNGVLLAPNPAPADVVAALERVLLGDDEAARASRREASRRRWAEGFDAELNHTRYAQRLRALFVTL